MAAIAFFFRPSVDGDASHFIDALLSRNWAEVYRFESDRERQDLGWDQPTFVKFCQVLSQQGWPSGLRPQIDEVLPIVNQPKPGEIGLDDSWNRAGTREYTVTLFQGKTSEQNFSLDYRHGPDGEWHPDMMSTLLRISKGDKVRGANPQRNLLEAMRAINSLKLTVYPEGDHTDEQLLQAYLSGLSKVWLEPGVQPLR